MLVTMVFKKLESTKIIQLLNFCLERLGDMLTIYMHTKIA